MGFVLGYFHVKFVVFWKLTTVNSSHSWRERETDSGGKKRKLQRIFTIFVKRFILPKKEEKEEIRNVLLGVDSVSFICEREKGLCLCGKVSIKAQISQTEREPSVKYQIDIMIERGREKKRELRLQ